MKDLAYYRESNTCSELRKLMHIYASLGEDGCIYEVWNDYPYDTGIALDEVVVCFLIIFEEMINKYHDEGDWQYVLYSFHLHYVENFDEYTQHIFWVFLSKIFERNYGSEAISSFLKFDILGYFYGNIPYSIMSKYVTNYMARKKLEHLHENAC